MMNILRNLEVSRMVVTSALILLLVVGCDAPYHTVIASKSMVVYHAEERTDVALGKYEYWVRDNSSQGWTLISDEIFQVGDTLNIITDN